jgi:hypothetical protein
VLARHILMTDDEVLRPKGTRPTDEHGNPNEPEKKQAEQQAPLAPTTRDGIPPQPLRREGA